MVAVVYALPMSIFLLCWTIQCIWLHTGWHIAQHLRQPYSINQSHRETGRAQWSVRTVQGRGRHGERYSHSCCRSQYIPHRQYISYTHDVTSDVFLHTTASSSSSSSHAGTVVLECFKDDNASQWKSGKFDPRSLKTPRTDRHLHLHGWLRRGPLPPCKIS